MFPGPSHGQIGDAGILSTSTSMPPKCKVQPQSSTACDGSPWSRVRWRHRGPAVDDGGLGGRVSTGHCLSAGGGEPDEFLCCRHRIVQFLAR